MIIYKPDETNLETRNQASDWKEIEDRDPQNLRDRIEATKLGMALSCIIVCCTQVNLYICFCMALPTNKWETTSGFFLSLVSEVTVSLCFS
jgi:hypothetical protein